jgi:hypothetical protein
MNRDCLMKIPCSVRSILMTGFAALVMVSTGCETKPPPPTIDLTTEIKDPSAKPQMDKVSTGSAKK